MSERIEVYVIKSRKCNRISADSSIHADSRPFSTSSAGRREFLLHLKHKLLQIEQAFAMVPRARVIIDTDPVRAILLPNYKHCLNTNIYQGVDDVAALLLTLASNPEDIEVLLISITYGNIDVQKSDMVNPSYYLQF